MANRVQLSRELEFSMAANAVTVRQVVDREGNTGYRRMERAAPSSTMGSLFDWDAIEAANRRSREEDVTGLFRNRDVCISCQVCGRLLKGKRTAERKYCSERCRKNAQLIQEREEAERAAEATRKRERTGRVKVVKERKPWIYAEETEVVCVQCGRTFMHPPTRNPRHVRKFCSNSCKAKSAWTPERISARRAERRRIAAEKRAAKLLEREKRQKEREAELARRRAEREAERAAVLAEKLKPYPCACCGKTITPRTGGGRQKKYCSKSCLEKAYYRRAVSAEGDRGGWLVKECCERRCAVCGGTFIQEPTRHPRRVKKYCSKQCASKAFWSARKERIRKERPVADQPHPCPVCGTWVALRADGKTGKQPIYCSRKCTERASYLRRLERLRAQAEGAQAEGAQVEN